MSDYFCNGIGHGAICGQKATIHTQSYKWNTEKEELEPVIVRLCDRHAEELRATMEEKFKTGRMV